MHYATYPPNLKADIEYFFREIHPTLSSGKDLYPEVFQRPDFFPLQRQYEMREMIRIARKVNPSTIMEIGTDKGGSLYHWCMCLNATRVIACEIRGTPFRGDFERAFPHIQFLWLPYSSYGEALTYRKGITQPTPDVVAEWLDDKHQLDCLFIDGDKLKFTLDFDLYRPMVSDKGVVFMHDIQDSPGPKESFQTVIKRGYSYKAVIDTRESETALQRERDGFPASTSYEGWLRHWRGRSCGVGVIKMKPTDELTPVA